MFAKSFFELDKYDLKCFSCCFLLHCPFLNLINVIVIYDILFSVSPSCYCMPRCPGSRWYAHKLENQTVILKVLDSDHTNLVVLPLVLQFLSTGQVGAQGHCIPIGTGWLWKHITVSTWSGTLDPELQNSLRIFQTLCYCIFRTPLFWLLNFVVQ